MLPGHSLVKACSVPAVGLPVPRPAGCGEDGRFPYETFRIDGPAAFDLLLFLLSLPLLDDGVCEDDDVVVFLHPWSVC